jgi:hypothetical protein
MAPGLYASNAERSNEFFENKENDEKISKGLLGKRTQTPSPSPGPTLARRCKDVEIKSETVPKVFVTV